MRIRSRRAAVVGAAVIALGLTIGGCGADTANPNDLKSIKVWSLENQTDRFTATQANVKEFTEKTGIAVDLQAVDESQLPQLIAQGAQAGTLPDVIAGVPLAAVRQLDTQQLLDSDAAKAIVDSLGEKTWAPSALKLTQDGDRQLVVPSDAWSQIVVYRTDLFEAAGLEPPTTYETLQAAAQALTKDGQFGITLATDPADVFTAQTFESLALGNNCQLVNPEGTVTLDSPECTTTFELYNTLATTASPKGGQSVDSTRESYFAGKSAMIIWSTFLLDEMAGLRDDALPTCPECKADPTFLSKNSGVVSAVSGPDGGAEGSFGEIGSYVTVADGKTAPSKEFIEYMLTDGYAKWFGMAPEGKFPVRTGDATDPEKYTDEWAKLPAGVDTKKPLSEVYSPETLEQITSIAEHIDRWAIPQGQGNLLGAMNAELTIPKVIAEMSTGGTDVAGAQAAAQEEAAQVKDNLKR
ncbi:ABC transporter substrate-binding protein [Nakamurella sp. GG22]